METSHRFERLRNSLAAMRPDSVEDITAAYNAMTQSPPVDPDPNAPDMRLEIVCDLLALDLLIDWRYGVVSRAAALDGTRGGEVRDFVARAGKLYNRRVFSGQKFTAEWLGLLNEVAIYQAAIDPGVAYGMLEVVRQAMADEEYTLHNVAAASFTTWDVTRPPDRHPEIRDWLVERVIHHLTNGVNQ